MCNSFNKKFIDEAQKAMEEQSEGLAEFHEQAMNTAIQEAIKGVLANDGGPFGCIVVKDGQIIGKGNNKVTSSNDPTAHAEVVAIREACRYLKSFQLEGCIIYTSCEPCPMCLGAIYWARPAKVYYGCSKSDAAKIGFDDDFIYKELELPLQDRSIPFEQICRQKSLQAFKTWEDKEDKINY